MKKILVITYDMIPYALTWGGSQRMYYLARALQDKGIDTTVFALRSSDYNDYGKQLIKNTVFTDKMKKHIVSNYTDLSYKNLNNKIKRIIKKTLGIVDSLIFNEIQRGNGIKAYLKYCKSKRVIKRAIRKEAYDLAIVSAPPFVLFNYVKVLRHLNVKKIVMDYRDPWNLWHDGYSIPSALEKQLQHMSDYIVCTNKQICIDMSKKYKVDRNKYFVVSNGYSMEYPSLEDCNNTELSNNTFNIVYTGSIVFDPSDSDYRNPTIFLKAIKTILERGITNFQVTFVGANMADIKIIKRIESELSNHVRIIGVVNNVLAKAYIQKADMCLLMHTTNDCSGNYLVSGKLYDYIQMKKFVLSIGPQNILHDRIISENKIGIHVENNIEELINGITKCYRLWEKGDLNNNGYNDLNVELFSRERQMNNYVDFIKRIMEEKA